METLLEEIVADLVARDELIELAEGAGRVTAMGLLNVDRTAGSRAQPHWRLRFGLPVGETILRRPPRDKTVQEIIDTAACSIARRPISEVTGITGERPLAAATVA